VDCVGQGEFGCVTYGLAASNTTNYYPGIQGTPVNGATPITFDLWNVFAIPESAVELCSISNCTPAANGTATSPIPVEQAFYDPGNNISVYNWTASTGTSIERDPTNYINDYGYQVTYPVPANNSAPITGSVSGTVPASIPAPVPARAELVLLTENVAPDITYSVTFTSTTGATYTTPLYYNYNDATYFTNSYADATTFPTNFNVASFTINYTIPAGDATGAAATQTFDISAFGVVGTNDN